MGATFPVGFLAPVFSLAVDGAGLAGVFVLDGAPPLAFGSVGFVAEVGFFAAVVFVAPAGFVTPVAVAAPVVFPVPVDFTAFVVFFAPVVFVVPLGFTAPEDFVAFDAGLFRGSRLIRCGSF